MRPARWLVEAPLALVSLALNRTLAARVRRAMAARAAEDDSPPSWTVMDAELLADDRNVLAFSLRAPRWNPHAAIAFSPPLAVRERIEIDAAAADRSSPRWTLVVYDRDGTRATVGTASHPAGEDVAAVVLPADDYRLAIRLYDPRPGAVVPEVRVDGEPVLAERPVPDGLAEAFAGLRSRARPLHRMLQRYVVPMIRLRGVLGERRVSSHYLPVGNPETTFRFGTVDRGEAVEVSLREPAPEGCGLYLCLYDRASFPAGFWTLPDDGLTTPPAPEDGTWLLRLVPGRRGVPGDDAISVRTVRARTGDAP